MPIQKLNSEPGTPASVVVGTSDGQGWLLLQQGGGRWRNRMSDVAAWGPGRHLLFNESPDGKVQQQWSEQTYDPRQRPWFSGAMGRAAPHAVHWTAPYLFFTTGDPGITVSMRTRLADGRDLVLGLDHVPTRNSLYALRAVETRANLLRASSVLDEAALDKYSFTREVFLSRRQSAIEAQRHRDEN